MTLVLKRVFAAVNIVGWVWVGFRATAMIWPDEPVVAACVAIAFLIVTTRLIEEFPRVRP